MAELLLELLCEEIPARMQTAAADRLLTALRQELGTVKVKTYVTPRRLTAVVRDLPKRQPDRKESRKGPRVGAPSAAVEAFARSLDLSFADLAVETLAKGDFHVAHWTRKGRATAAVLAEKLPDLVRGLAWPKTMRWGSGPMRWVRPLRRVLCLFDGKPIELDIANVPCGVTTVGHRVHAPEPFTVTSFADYEKKLREARVMVDEEKRFDTINEKAHELASKEGLEIKPDHALLEELAGLVEWPEVLIGSIDESFMGLPAKVLTAVIQNQQKYLTLEGADGSIAPRFIVVADVKAIDGGEAIVAGSERVLRARFADAKFFWEQDTNRSLASYVPQLDKLVFHAKLGSMGDRTTRLEVLSDLIGAHLPNANPTRVRRAAKLCKADLLTQMVAEFPELQGLMGSYYSYYASPQEHADVCAAIAEHYSPRGQNDICPTAPVSIALALADKIDTLVSMFAIGEKPTGSKDPYALRRAALGVIRLIIENGLRLRLREVFRHAHLLLAEVQEGVGGEQDPDIVASDLLAFLVERLKVHLRGQGLRHDLISAVFALDEDDLINLKRRAYALGGFLETEDGDSLLIAHQRANNIVRIEEKKDGRMYEGDDLREEHLVEPAEKALLERHAVVQDLVSDAMRAEDYERACRAFAGLREPVDAFFEQVRVNVDDVALRENRLRLLDRVRTWFLLLADFSQIEG